MEKEYRSLVHETKAIEPVDLSMLNPENVKVRKAGPNGGKKNVGLWFVATCCKVTWTLHRGTYMHLAPMAS